MGPRGRRRPRRRGGRHAAARAGTRCAGSGARGRGGCRRGRWGEHASYKAAGMRRWLVASAGAAGGAASRWRRPLLGHTHAPLEMTGGCVGGGGRGAGRAVQVPPAGETAGALQGSHGRPAAEAPRRQNGAPLGGAGSGSAEPTRVRLKNGGYARHTVALPYVLVQPATPLPQARTGVVRTWPG